MVNTKSRVVCTFNALTSQPQRSWFLSGLGHTYKELNDLQKSLLSIQPYCRVPEHLSLCAQFMALNWSSWWPSRSKNPGAHTDLFSQQSYKDRQGCFRTKWNNILKAQYLSASSHQYMASHITVLSITFFNFILLLADHKNLVIYPRHI